MALKITDSITYVGIDDPAVRRFESQYPTPMGMAYNSYVIVDDRIAVMDSVEANGGDRWIDDILAATGGRNPDYLIVQHMEPDHSANIAKALGRFPEMKVVASAAAIKMLPQFFPSTEFGGRTVAVKDGDSLELGRHTLNFYTAPMIHWPEVIVTFESATGTLFSADAFGKFGAIQYADDWISEARRYYINIVGRYGVQVQQLLKKVSGLPIERIASLHGPVLHAPLDKYISLYDRWSRYEPEQRGILIAYASIYGGTADAALRLADMLRQLGVGMVLTMDLTTCDVSEAVAQAFRLSHLVLAAPTYDSGLFPPMYDFIHHLTIKNFRNRAVAYVENGSWAPTAARRMNDLMATMPGITAVEPVVTIRSRLNADSLAQLETLSRSLAASVTNHD